MNNKLIFFRKFFNVSSTTLIEFSVGFFDGAILTNFTVNKGPEGALAPDLIPENTKNLISDNAKEILLRVGAGGGILKMTPIAGRIARIVAGATPNLLP